MFHGPSILIVEDEAIIALALAFGVREAGGLVVGPSRTVEQALVLLGSNEIEVAILDANLADRDVTPLALELYRKNIPFVLHSAKGPPPQLALALPDLPIVMKPAATEDVIEVVMNLIALR